MKMIPISFLITILAILLLGHNTVASPLPYQSIAKISTDPTTGRYRHHTDSDPQIDAVYDKVRLRQPYSERLEREMEESFS